MSGSYASNQREIRLAVSVIRRWLLTLCHDCCLARPPEVEIRKRAHSKAINAPIAGEAISDLWRVRIYLHINGTEVDYIRTLAHEIRHLWLHQNGDPQEERPCEEYDEEVLKRFRNGPEAGPYDGPIMGLSVVHRCSGCGGRVLDAWVCQACIARAAEDARRHRVAETERINAETAAYLRQKSVEREEARKREIAEEKRAATERKEAANAQARQKEIDWWRRKIDNHPDNGKSGYWLVDGQFYVRAQSAGEALIKVSGNVALDNYRRPKVKFVGDKVAGGSTRLG